MNTLLIDSGNTRLKWACAAISKNTDLRSSTIFFAQGVIDPPIALQALEQSWQSQLAIYPLERIIIANVAGEARAQIITAVLKSIFLKSNKPLPSIEWFQSSAYCAGVRNQYTVPEQLGCDRMAACIAAHHLVSEQNLVVVNCGTALTIDFLLQHKNEVVHLGGMILPGTELMHKALATHTAQLPRQVGEFVDLPKNTRDAISTGIIQAQLGSIDRAKKILLRHVEQVTNIQIIFSGGGAKDLLPYITEPYQSIDHIVLKGLAVYAKVNL